MCLDRKGMLDFAVAEHLNGKPGQYFTLEQTLKGIEEIINGKTEQQEPSNSRILK